ncbi:hypothetical protein BURKHO8Y_100009 [Burkholderia sp. 8Y]|nr:hypothetical protein BURKHO8Y_100009 [Burkholderia sp. 8Y]
MNVAAAAYTAGPPRLQQLWPLAGGRSHTYVGALERKFHMKRSLYVGVDWQFGGSSNRARRYGRGSATPIAAALASDRP